MREIVQKTRALTEDLVSRIDFRKPPYILQPDLTERIVNLVLDIAAEAIAATKMGIEIELRRVRR